MNRILNVSKRLLISGASVWLMWCTISYALYRISSGDVEETFDGEVHYKFLDFGLTNRALFEDLFGNQIVRLEGQPALYVPDAQRARLWQESPHEMLEKKYTLRAKLKSKRLLFGGYGVAEIASIERLEKEPIMSK